MSLKEQLGKRIKEIRKLKNYTQGQLAGLVGIEEKSLSKLENGRNYPSAETLTAIVKALDVEPYELFVFDKEIPYDEMRKEIIQALDNDSVVLMLYKNLKNINCD